MNKIQEVLSDLIRQLTDVNQSSYNEVFEKRKKKMKKKIQEFNNQRTTLT